MNCSPMDRHNVLSVVLLFCFLSLATITLGNGNGNANVFCREQENKALLNFKQGLVDSSNRLSSWTGENCCLWEGVGCDNETGHVVILNLRNPYDPSTEAFTNTKLSGEVSNSLLELKHLHYLDLSSNNFIDAPFPKFLASLTNLRYLDLHYLGFSGVIPPQFGNLTSLRHLDFGGNILNVENLEWISHLSFLEYLDMSLVSLAKAPNWLQVINMLPSVTELHLSFCGLNNIHPLPYDNLSSLVTLDLSENNLFSSSLDWLRGMTSLVTLDLSHNQFHGSIPLALQNMTSLRFLDLSNNRFNFTIPDWFYDITSLETVRLSSNIFQSTLSGAVGNLTSLIELGMSFSGLKGEIPRSLANLCNLRYLDLSSNKLNGGISGVLESLSACIMKKLEVLRLKENNLSGHLPDELGECKNLSVLSISSNSFSGPIPSSIGGLSSLSVLEMNDNQLNGTIPESLGQLLRLEQLDVSNNVLEGVVSEVLLANLTRLTTFAASSNLLTLQVSPNWIPSFQLQFVSLGSWQLGPRFPEWLPTQKDLVYLDLSNAGISDAIPHWLWNMSHIEHLNLSHNQIHGNVPNLTFGSWIYLGSNNLTGPLPHISSGIRDLDLSNNSFDGSLSPLLCSRVDGIRFLSFVDLSSNLLSGELSDCWLNWTELIVLRLGNNYLTGNIPSSMGSLLLLESLHLRSNSLYGNIPSSLQTCARLRIVDLSENALSGSIPTWMGEIATDLMILSLRSNKLSDSIPLELCHLDSLQILDLADNNISGTIPPCFNNLSAMTIQKNSTERIYYSRYVGAIETALLVIKRMTYEYSNTLTLVTTMDLSCNSLSGEIPEELTSLYGLISLNLSENHLKGKIPEKVDAMKSLESLDLSLNQLSGVIPQSLAELTFLGHLNLSYNRFSGRIPSSTQLQSFTALSFVGNIELCGQPLNNCIGDDAPPQPIPKSTDDDQEDHGWIDMKWFYLSIPLGYVVGFWGFCGPLAFNKSWRYAYFRFLDDMKYKLWDFVWKCK